MKGLKKLGDVRMAPWSIKTAGIRGFTLIELMIVVAIVATLAAVAIPAYYNYTMRSRQSAVIGELMAIKSAEERFFADNGGYAGKMNRTGFMYATAGTYTSGYYQYWIPANTNTLITTGAIRAQGDLNRDGNFTDVWEVSIDNLSDKPKPVGIPNEGFGWSSLGHLFN